MEIVITKDVLELIEDYGYFFIEDRLDEKDRIVTEILKGAGIEDPHEDLISSLAPYSLFSDANRLIRLLAELALAQQDKIIEMRSRLKKEVEDSCRGLLGVLGEEDNKLELNITIDV